MNMQFSDDGLKFLIDLEENGIPKLKPYPDGAGNMAIGFGHTIKPNEQYLLKGITPEKARSILYADTLEAQKAVNRNVRVPLAQYQFDALVILIFNIGIQAFQGSTILRLLNKQDYAGAEKHFDDWVNIRSGGKLRYCAGLQNRRDEEQELFNHGDYERQR